MTFSSPYASPPRKQMIELLKRFVVHYWRTPNYNFLRLFLIAVLALLFGSVFFQLDTTSESGIRGKVAYIYFTCAFCGVLNMAGVLNVVIAQRAVYYRERASKTYTVEPFNFGMLFAEIPYLLLTGTIFVCIMYFMVGFDADFGDFMFFWLIFTTYMSMMTFYGQFLSIMFPTVQIAQTVGSAVVTIWNLFCGFLVPRPKIPTFWIWLYWLSPIRYALESLSGSQFYCEGGIDVCPWIYVTEDKTIKPKTVWAFVSDEFGFNYDSRWPDFFAILAFLIVFRFGGFLGLKYVKHITR
jgi:ABC-type multidrug transport system permease subunit